LLTHCAARVRSKVLHRCRLRGSRYYDDSMLHRFVLLQDSLGTCHRRVFLTDCHVDTQQVFALLVNDRIDSNSRLAGLAVATDQLTLAAPDGNHAINRFDTGLKRRIYRLARNYTRGYTHNGTRIISYN